MQFPFSRDEQAAIARYVAGVRKQLQDVSDLVATRYSKESSISEIAEKTLVSATLLEQEFLLLDPERRSNEAHELHGEVYAKAS